jgi:hypothetical protein
MSDIVNFLSVCLPPCFKFYDSRQFVVVHKDEVCISNCRITVQSHSFTTNFGMIIACSDYGKVAGLLRYPAPKGS